jgi:prepilin-type N-terminal cleavage/methylation domain-containing protein
VNCNRGFGFSVIELLTVLAVMGIVVGIALPGWNRLLPSYHLSSSARQVQSELHNIRMRAAAENIPFQFVYVEGASDYTILKEGKNGQTKSLPEGISVSKTGTISFSPRGTAGANRVRLRNGDGSCQQVVVSPTGRVRICKPNPCSADC